MKKPAPEKPWRLEVNDPQRAADWRRLWAFGEGQLAAYQELRDELNIINAPIQLRIVPDRKKLSKVSAVMRVITGCL
jgi:hypothetical protein